MFADPPNLFQARNAPNTSETQMKRSERLCELGQPALMNSAIQFIVAKALVTSNDPLERLVTMSQQASPVSRLRIERTIRIIMRARQAVAAADRSRQESSERLMLARNSAWRARVALQIIHDRHHS
jgi:hypothetical protein